MKICNKCKVEKLLTDFYKNKNICKACRKIYDKDYYQKNKSEIDEYQKNYRQDNKEDIADLKKDFYQVNKEEILEKQKEYREDNKEQISKKKKFYYQNNKNKIKDTHKKYDKKQRMNNPSYKLRRTVSNLIYQFIKENKNNQSCLLYLPWTISELKFHIESLFEPWMTWDNWGVFNSATWNDSDPATWRWQIDHIISHSTFLYKSMDCQEFRDCWALSNLRPLNAKQNVIDGAREVI